MIGNRIFNKNKQELLKIINTSTTNPNTVVGSIIDINRYPNTIDVLKLYIVGCYEKSKKLVFNFSKLNTTSMIESFIDYLTTNKLLISYENGVLIAHFDITECNNLLFTAFEAERNVDFLTAEEKVIE
jgi:hypothetical protein